VIGRRLAPLENVFTSRSVFVIRAREAREQGREGVDRVRIEHRRQVGAHGSLVARPRTTARARRKRREKTLVRANFAIDAPEAGCDARERAI
jgi:hypothetical protein